MNTQHETLVATIKAHLQNVGPRTDGQLLYDVGKTLNFPPAIGTFCGHDVCRAAHYARIELANEKRSEHKTLLATINGTFCGKPLPTFKPAPMLFHLTLRHPQFQTVSRYVGAYRLESTSEFDDMIRELGWVTNWEPIHTIPDTHKFTIVLF
jgi:hypothetical protein